MKDVTPKIILFVCISVDNFYKNEGRLSPDHTVCVHMGWGCAQLLVWCDGALLRQAGKPRFCWTECMILNGFVHAVFCGCLFGATAHSCDKLENQGFAEQNA